MFVCLKIFIYLFLSEGSTFSVFLKSIVNMIQEIMVFDHSDSKCSYIYFPTGQIYRSVCAFAGMFVFITAIE